MKHMKAYKCPEWRSGSYNSERNELLIGQTIASVEIGGDYRDKVYLHLTNGKTISGRTDGDCCSMSWVEAIEEPALGYPATITAVQDLSLATNNNTPNGVPLSKHHKLEDCDSLAFYGLKITTDKGELIIDYRNDSNGYYGGDMDNWRYEELPEEQ